jgi:ABC-type iron transport system FetAB permease component
MGPSVLLRHAHSNEEQAMAGSSHGHTPAAWTGVTIAFIGFCVSGAFMVLDQPVGFWAGMVVVLLGGVVGAIMRMMGLGQPKEAHQPHRMTGDREPAGAGS